jgi:hypothetical protein
MTNKIKPKQIVVTTSIGNPGVDTNIPSEKAVRTALNGVTGSSGISEAPINGSPYVRQNAGWVSATGTSGALSVDGWTSVSDSWAYASASTITVPSGAANIYSVGDRIKWTQTTVRYGVIVTVADTLLTIAVNTNYVVATPTAISNIYYSHEVSPLGFPQWFACAATVDVGYMDNGAGGQPTISECRYSIIGRTCTVHLRATGTKASTNNVVFIIADTVFPLINRTNNSGRSAVGTLIVYAAADFYGVTLHYTDNNYYAVTASNITDNVTITDASILIAYEI